MKRLFERTNEYVLWGLTVEHLKEAYENGLPRRFRLVFNEFGFSHVAVSMTPEEAVKTRRIIRQLNDEYNLQLKLFRKDEWEAA